MKNNPGFFNNTKIHVKREIPMKNSGGINIYRKAAK